MLDMMSLKNFSFLIYGLGFTGRSVIKFLKKKDISNYYVWDDNKKWRKKFRSKETNNLKDTLKRVDFIVLSPGISLKKAECLIYYNIDFSATSYWQSRDRMTTKDSVQNDVYWIFSKGGIEDKIYQAVTKKKDYTLSHFKKDLLSL